MATQRLKQRLTRLSKAEMVEVRDYLDTLIAQAEEAEAEAAARIGKARSSSGGDSRKTGGGSAWVELKTINGCGPYAYRRWYEGKRCRSQYIGKVKKEG